MRQLIPRHFYRRGLDLKNVSLVYVYFGDISYVEYRRENILHWDELLGKSSFTNARTLQRNIF